METKYPIVYDRTEWRPLAPHLQRNHGGTESIVARLFCYRTFSKEMTPNMEVLHLTEYEIRVLADVTRAKHPRR